MICPVFELINNLLLFSKIKMIFEVLILKVAFFLLSFIVFPLSFVTLSGVRLHLEELTICSQQVKENISINFLSL